MKTKVLKIDPKKPEKRKIKEAAQILRSGGLVAFPTETVYGLGADALNSEAVKKIFAVKGRPMDNPLIVHIASIEEVPKITDEVPEKALQLMKRFWPGPLTLVLKKKSNVPDIVTAGLDTVAIRMPDDEIALALIRESGTPVVAPSANISGKPSSTVFSHVVSDFKGKVEVIIEGGDTRIGVESTVLDMTTEPVMLLRPGGLSLEEIEAVAGRVELHSAIDTQMMQESTRSPGMKYKHYAPEAKLILVEGEGMEALLKVNSLIKEYRESGLKVGVITMRTEGMHKADVVKSMSGLTSYARSLFAVFREFDEADLDVIIVENVEEKGLGLAIMNRLRKAAYKIV